MNAPAAPRPAEEAWPADFPEDAWAQFTGARSSVAFCQAWLHLMRARVPTLKLACVLVAGETGQLVPAASWPDTVTDFKHWEETVAASLESAPPQSLTRPCGSGTLLTKPIVVADKVAAMICLELAAPVSQATPAARELHWSSAWLMHLMAQHGRDEASLAADRLRSALDLSAVCLGEGSLSELLHELLFELREQFGATGASLGWVSGLRARLALRSDTIGPEKGTPLAAATVAAMEECLDHGRLTEWIEGATLPAHQTLRERSAAMHVASLPLVSGAQTVAIVTFERATAAPFTDDQRARLEALSGLLGALLHQRQQAQAHALSRLLDHSKEALNALFGPRHLVAKFALTTTLLLFALLTLFPIEHRIRAHTVVEGAVQHTLAAPFQGFIGASHQRAGDRVRAGQLLAELDARELLLERTRAQSEREQYDRKIRDALAQHDMGNLQVLRASEAQAQAALDLAEEKIQRARITAPIDGILISGDWSQQLGAPVEIGQKLFEVAPLSRFRVILEVEEQDIAHVREGQHGRLVLNGIEGKPMAFTVARITPLASAHEGKNIFRVEARILDAADRLLPGMEGAGKIHAGQQPLGWVLFHPFIDWLSLKLWHLAP